MQFCKKMATDVDADVGLERVLNAYLAHEQARLEVLENISSKELEKALDKASLMPRQICLRAATELRDLITYTCTDVDGNPAKNPAYAGSQPLEKRHDGKGWTKEYITAQWTSHIKTMLEEMSMEISRFSALKKKEKVL
jgi:hypothetical protein